MSLENVEDIYPLTPTQQGMLVHTLSEPNSGVYIQQICTTLEGEIDVAAIRSAWQDVVNQFEALRTTFLWEDLEEPLQVVQKQVEVSWTVLDWKSHDWSRQESELTQLLMDDRRLGFNLAVAPLMRMTLIQRADRIWLWIWSFHHILCDGWSVSIIRGQFDQNYQARRDGKVRTIPPGPLFRDHVARLSDDSNEETYTYWQEKLKGFTSPTSLIGCNASRLGSNNYQQQQVVLSAEMTEALKAIARQYHVTLNTLIHGAWSLVLSRCARQADVVYGATMSGRAYDTDRLKSAVGMYINTLPIRVKTDGTETVSAWLKELQQQLLDTLAREQSSLSKIQQVCDLPGGLFETLVVFENYPVAAESKTDSLKTTDVQFIEQSNFPLALLVVPDDQMRLILLHDIDRIAVDYVSAQLCALENILKQFLDESKKSLDSILLSGEFAAPKPNRISAHESVEFTSIVELISTCAREQPDRLAIQLAEECLTYSELDRRANHVAAQLKSFGVALGESVAVCCGRSTELIPAILGILKAGAAYVPLDPAQPEARLKKLLKICEAGAIVCDQQSRDSLSWAPVPIVQQQVDEQIIDQTVAVDASDSAYLIFTSGSSGQPKAVRVSHGALLQSTEARVDYYAENPHKYLLMSPVWFDSSIAGVFWTLASGSTLVIPSESMTFDVPSLARFIQRCAVTHTLCLPRVYQLLLRFANSDELSTLKCVIVAGEACTSAVVKQHFSLLPDTRLFNEYGPTEASVWATVYELTPDDAEGDVPIGKAASGCMIELIDHTGQVVPNGLPGEIFIGGSRLADGYVGASPDLTSPFVQREGNRYYRTGDLARVGADGNLMFLGRADDQFKVNGQRLDPEEIESVLRGCEGVDEVIVGLTELDDPDHWSADSIAKGLASLPSALADSLLKEVQQDSGADETVGRRDAELSIQVAFQEPDFIPTPTPRQRKWMIDQALAELAADLRHLHRLAPSFVRGSDQPHHPRDLATERLTDQEIMEDWQTPMMKAMADYACVARGDVLEIGFGRGVAASFIQEAGPGTHTIIEMSEHCIRDFYEPWSQQYSGREIRLVPGRWQDVLSQLDQYDTVFFHAFPMNEEEFVRYIANSATFAEHFFATAAQLLRPGGVFTYMTTEIDSVSRRHQRALFQYFDEIQMKLQRLHLPEDTRDAWWASSMVVLKATLHK